MGSRLPVIAITSGEPAGIGPDLVLALARGDFPARIVVIDHVPLASAVRPGHLDPANGPYVLATLDRAIDGCLAGEFDAMVTAPVHKGAINDAGIPFTGHTEYLAQRTGAGHVVMMLAGGGLRV